MIYKPFDVVVPFPFMDSARSKRRPALVLSGDEDFGNEMEHSVLTMITSQKNVPRPLDSAIKNKKSSGLSAPSVVRMKLFTLNNRFILRKISQLSKSDQKQVKQSLSTIFPYL